MTEQLRLPPPLDFESRQLGPVWKAWRKRCMVYLTASDNDEASEKKEKSLLLHALGPEAIDISETFFFTKDDGEKKDPTFDELVARFDAHFLPRVNVTFERHQFFTRNQEPGESVDRYITALRKLAQTCEFGEIRDSLVRDRFICGLSTVAVKEKLLGMPNITLETAIDKCKAAGLVKDQLRVIDAPADEQVADVKASGVMCRSTPADAQLQPVYTEDTQEEMAHTDDIVHAVGPLVIEDEGEAKTRFVKQTLHIGMIEGDGAAWMTEVLTNGSPIRCKLDTGAQANILPYAVYRQMTSRPKLHKATTRLFAYGAVSPISVAGQCVCELSVQGGISRKWRFYVLAADVKAVLLLGLTVCDQLDFIRLGEAGMADVGSVSTFSDDPVVAQYLDLFEGAGKILGAQYSIKLRENALPVALGVARRLAYPQYRKVEEELKRMQRLDV